MAANAPAPAGPAAELPGVARGDGSGSVSALVMPLSVPLERKPLRKGGTVPATPRYVPTSHR